MIECLLNFIFAVLVSIQTSRSENQLFDKIIEANQEYVDRTTRTGNYRLISTRLTKTKGLGTDFSWNLSTKRLINLKADCFLSDSQASGLGMMSSVISINSKYCFELERDEKDSQWKLHRYAISDSPDLDMQELGFEFSVRRPSKTDLDVFFMPVVLSGTPRFRLSEVAKMDKFKVDSIETNGSLLVLRFQYMCNGFRDYKANTQKDALLNCELTLDSNISFLPTKLVQTTTLDGKVHRIESKVDREFQNGLVVREQHEMKQTISQTDFLKETIESCEYDYSRIPESEFLLTAYGFPEPTELAKKPWMLPANIWLLLIGVVLIATAVFFKVRANQAR